MLKIYTDKDFLTQKYRKNIFPLLLDVFFLANAELLKYYQLVDSLEDSDIAILPVDVSYLFRKKRESYLYSFVAKAQQLHKTVWVYSGGDIGKTIDLDVHVFRLGGFHSKLSPKSYILPSFVQDPCGLFIDASFAPIPKATAPVLGFVGHANGSVKGLLHEFSVFMYLVKERFFKNKYFDSQAFYPSGFHRFKLLSSIQKNPSIQANFILRENYTGGSQTKGEIKESTMVFYNNLFQNPYVFCLRGLGNFSVRFYEALIMGRIPVVVHTDMRLPLQDAIRWEDHCVFVKQETFEDDLLRFHQHISEDDFVQMQINNRALAISLLSREGYFKQVHHQFVR